MMLLMDSIGLLVVYAVLTITMIEAAKMVFSNKD